MRPTFNQKKTKVYKGPNSKDTFHSKADAKPEIDHR